MINKCDFSSIIKNVLQLYDTSTLFSLTLHYIYLILVYDDE